MESSQSIFNSIHPMSAMVISLVISLLLIPFVKRYAPKLGMIDTPGSHKIHSTPVPCVGGCGIVLGVLIPVLFLLESSPEISSYLLGATILFFLGVWDDINETGHTPKFVGQFIAACIVVCAGDLWIQYPISRTYDSWPTLIAIPFTIIAIIGMINATNHSDGLDGLAGGEASLSLIVIVYFSYIAEIHTTTFIAIASMGSVIGFLYYNTHPAKVFMGDAGSTFLGFTLAILVINLTQHDQFMLSPTLALLILGLPVIDTLSVFYLRIREGKSWFEATQNHIHHRLMDLGFTHVGTVRIIYTIQSIFVLTAIILSNQNDYLILFTYLSYAFIVLMLLTYAERTNWHT